MQSFVLEGYPPDVPHEVHPEQYRSVGALFEESFRRHADRPFSICMERWIRYGELDSLSRAMGAWLQSLDLEPGARVAIMLPNVPQFAVAMCGILRAGYVCVNVNPLYTARELEHQLRDSGATVIIILENFAATLEQVVDNTSCKARGHHIDGRSSRRNLREVDYLRGSSSREAGSSIQAPP